MNKRIYISVIIFFSLSIFAFTLKEMWKVVNAEKVEVAFKLQKDGTKGIFTGIDVDFNLDLNKLEKSSIIGVIDVKTINTQNKRRDDHLCSADFFDAEKYPKITFKSSKIVKKDKQLMIIGNLKIKEIVKEIEVPFDFKEKGDMAEFSGKMLVSPFEFGVFGSEKKKDELAEIEISFSLKK